MKIHVTYIKCKPHELLGEVRRQIGDVAPSGDYSHTFYKTPVEGVHALIFNSDTDATAEELSALGLTDPIYVGFGRTVSSHPYPNLQSIPKNKFTDKLFGKVTK